MKLDKLQHLINKCKAECPDGQQPRTILLCEADRKSLGLPLWTKNLFGLKVVIAQNYDESKVTHHIYEEVKLHRRNDDNSNA